jgi:amino acid transporter
VQAFIGRIVYSMSRDGVLPASATLRRVSRRHVPYAATTAVALGGIAGLFLGLDSAAVGTLIASGTGGFFVMFAIVTWSALVARITGRWDSSRGELRLGRAGLALNAAAALWATFEAINVAWPRAVLAPPGAPWWQVWAVVLVSGAVTIFALAYMVLRRPQDRLRGGDVLAVQGPPDDAGPALESAGARTAS